MPIVSKFPFVSNLPPPLNFWQKVCCTVLNSLHLRRIQNLKQQNVMKKLLSLACVAMLSVSCFTSCSSNSSEPEDVAKEAYTTMFEGGDITKYLSPSVSSDLKEMVQKSAEETQEKVKEGNIKIKKIDVLRVKKEEDHARVRLEVTVEYDDDGERKTDTERESMNLQKVDGKWYIGE